MIGSALLAAIFVRRFAGPGGLARNAVRIDAAAVILMVLFAIAIIFMRNQIRPIRKLAVAAERMGKGRDMPSLKPTGAREVRQATEAFDTMQRRIRRQIEQRTTMLAGVSHDLRTPLTRLKLQTSMLDNEKEAAAMRKDLDDMERMIKAYLEFARGQQVEGFESIELISFLKDLIPDYAHTGAEIMLEPDVENIRLSVQPLNFKRCLDNILSNAARYGDKILITVEASENRVYVSIEDNGPGIPEENSEDVFKPFVRLDPSRSADTGGAGLGLSVAMDIMLSHGGKISVAKSARLGGAKVFLGLPL
jgi:two-component system osmolarity sensor histidine kinase EnvZ